jgi:shikimate kinase
MQSEHAIPRNVERIVLIGFMGAGKSTVGPILAERLGWRFLDADRELEFEAGVTIADLFSTLGEPGFRRKEAQVVARLCATTATVLALGGGAIETESTRTLLANSTDTYVIFLEASLEVLMERCEQQLHAAVRPILRQPEALQQRFHSRLPHYRSAHLTMNTEGLDPHAVADRLLRHMRETSNTLPLYQKATTT